MDGGDGGGGGVGAPIDPEIVPWDAPGKEGTDFDRIQGKIVFRSIAKFDGDKAREVEQLQLVLRRYPKSGQSSTAHQRLESYGVKIMGGEAKAEE